MPTPRILISLFLILVFLIGIAPMVYASGGGEAKPAEGAAPAAKDSPEAKEFREKSAKLAGLETRINDMNKTIAELIEKKRQSKNSEATRTLMAELVKVSQERNKSVKEHGTLKQYLLYRFPNLGESVTKQYGVHEEMNVDQLERSSGIDNILSDLKQTVMKKYAPIVEKSESKDKGDVPPPAPKQEEEPPLRLVK